MRWEVFYYQTERGDSPIEEFLNTLPRKARAKCLAYIDMLEEFGLSLPRAFIAKIREELWELRPEWAGTEYRFLYCMQAGRKVIIVHALTKKAQKLKTGDIELALARAAEVKRRLTREGASPIRQRTDQA